MSVSAQELIVWTSPAAFALALYLAHEAYSSIKDDIKDLQDKQESFIEKLSESKSEIKIVGQWTKDQCKKIDAVLSGTKETKDFIGKIEARVALGETNYGRVILILKRIISILSKKNSQDQSEPL